MPYAPLPILLVSCTRPYLCLYLGGGAENMLSIRFLCPTPKVKAEIRSGARDYYPICCQAFSAAGPSLLLLGANSHLHLFSYIYVISGLFINPVKIQSASSPIIMKFFIKICADSMYQTEMSAFCASRARL